LPADFQAFKVDRGDPNDSPPFDDFVQALEDAFNDLGGVLTSFAPGLVFDPAQLKQGGAASGDWLAWDGTDWAKGTPPAGTIVVIGDQELATNAATITFSSIPGTYKHLLLQGYYRCDRGSSSPGDMGITINNDSGANYDDYSLTAQGTTPTLSAAQHLAASRILLPNAVPSASEEPANSYDHFEIWIPHYAGAANNKMLHGHWTFKRGTATGQLHIIWAMAAWRSNSAITRIDITEAAGSSNYMPGSRFTLYGF
jgi:hypothetical protein